MPISDQFVNDEAPEWTWGDPSQLSAAPAVTETAQHTAGPTAESGEDELVGRPWLDALMGLVIFLVSQLIVGAIALLTYIWFAFPDGVDLSRLQELQTQNPDFIPATLYPVAISTILMAWGWSYVGNRTPKTLLNWGFKKVDLLWGILAVGLSVVIGGVVGIVLRVPAEESAQLNNAIWPEGASPVIAFLLLLAIGVLVPISEEMVFRGLIQNALARRYNDAVGLIAASIIFAIPHIPNFIQLKVSGAAMAAGMLQVTLLGFVIGGIFIYTRRLGACIAAHIFNNCMAVGTLIYFTFFAS